jgi:hypothetical protein
MTLYVSEYRGNAPHRQDPRAAVPCASYTLSSAGTVDMSRIEKRVKPEPERQERQPSPSITLPRVNFIERPMPAWWDEPLPPRRAAEDVADWSAPVRRRAPVVAGIVPATSIVDAPCSKSRGRRDKPGDDGAGDQSERNPL